MFDNIDFYRNVLGVGFLIFIVFRWSRKIQKQSEDLLEVGYHGKYSCRLVTAEDNLSAKVASVSGFGVFADVVLYEDRVVFITGRKDIQATINIEDIEYICLKKLVWKKSLYLEQSLPNSINKNSQGFMHKFYLTGDESDLVKIKEFIEKKKKL